ncbi:Putative colanic biosynthesis UDP-glucose lipid carrier transferase [uncultured Eubacterium sp.]|nr:Putative colanic biosynthesis UDP-glucose lipid carrier transferase [uncultured Eubacterium sp.]
MKKGKDSFYAKYIKRLLDILLSLCALIALSPVLLIVALLVRIKLGSPVIFKQQRPGKNEKIFTLYKFRSMTDEKDAEGNLLSDDVRLTKFGRILRSTSLDELPELWNILKGDMSVVGPRPLLVEYLPLYSDFQRRRHSVKPGLSGSAQVKGRNLLTWEERFLYDVNYIRKMSLLCDTTIVFKTIFTVLRHEDINSRTNATMENFKGTGT